MTDAIDATKDALSDLLEEAEWIGFDLDEALRSATASFRILSLPERGSADYPTIDVRLSGILRIAAVHLDSHWSNRSARTLHLELSDLAATFAKASGSAVYGEDLFFRSAEAEFAKWADRLSLDWCPSSERGHHCMLLFQEAGQRHFEVWIWFANLAVTDHLGMPVSLPDLLVSSRRWWQAMRQGDPRTADRGIIPLKP